MLSDKILAKITHADIELAANLWGGRTAKPEALGNVENLVYACHPGFALRLVSCDHRSASQVEAELAWMAYLKNLGLPVVESLPGINGNHLEPVDIGGHTFFVSALRWIEGTSFHPQKTPDFWQPERIATLGKTVAKLHKSALVEPEQVKHMAAARFDPFAAFEYNMDTFTKNTDLDVAVFRDLEKNLHTRWELEQFDARLCGLIHGDIHSGNFIAEADGTLRVFDFDDCHRGWWSQDIALALYYLSLNLQAQEKTLTAEHWHTFKEAYTDVLPLPPGFEEDLPLFMQYRDWKLLGFLFARFGQVENFPENAKKSYERICQRLISDTLATGDLTLT